MARGPEPWCKQYVEAKIDNFKRWEEPVSRYYDRAGNTMTQDAWNTRFGDYDYKRVDKTEEGDWEVSTVWLGLDHQWGDGPPHIFETMIFGGEHDQGCWRYATEAEAIAGHQRVVEALRAGIDPYED